ncbi:glycosyltransferase family 4 protein [Halobacterium wangiae]|uniref:glycosyltransferase family 4 protein n=1 Tax=Halobacterium wangiae TaxID=2902623 RepID=UPI001E50C792|nr:glycosyltransferase family 4 protein [Halobacterium wangiae]
MKIGYFCYRLSGTGPRTRAKDIINGVATKTDHDVVVLTKEPGAVSDRAEVVEISLQNILGTAMATKRALSDVDVAHVPINIYQVLFVRLFYRGPLVAGVGPGIQPGRRHRLLGYLLGIDKKMVVSKERSRWTKSGFDTTSVTATINRENFHPYDEDGTKRARTKLNIPAGVDVVLYVGELNEEYGAGIVDEMARIERGDDSLQFIVVGEGEMRNRFRDRTNVRYEGFVDNDQLPVYYNAADVTIGPRRTDKTSNVGLESIACGTPFVTTADGLLEEIFEKHGSYVWAERTPEAVLSTVRALLDDSTEYEEQVKRGLDTFEEAPLSLDTAIDTHLEVYEEVSNRGP